MSNETPLHGNPSPRTCRRRRSGISCRRRGHRPVLVERHYYVAAGQVELLCEARDLLSDASFPLLGRRAKERHGRAVICRRCLAPSGDTVPEVAR
ncbi:MULTISPECIES: hypothetical protein [unclassified Nocardioides]|uniref:hypothetical protein n=1 Tax=unclassified Nocardioides TaxID=2615069 RepID=UPI0009F15FD6|nr:MULTISPECIES: hypothetical protein [unclassified Nocardioides]GAW49684.1 hypothetical protein PD653B2_2011 [Nocardioides sp. PD653-B2]GAW56576.1 hypothetical protein PD653_4013 [Nocardioides sp. PD653]